MMVHMFSVVTQEMKHKAFESSKIFVPEWDSREDVSQGSDEGIQEEQLSLSLETNRREFVGQFQFVLEGWV